MNGRKAIVREQWLTAVVAVLAFGTALPVIYDSIALALHHARAGAVVRGLATFSLVVLAAVLLYGIVAYLAARMAHLARLRAASSDQPGASITYDPALDHASVVVLIPAHLEDADVVWRAVASAALQPHPNRRVVVLIDDAFTSPRQDGANDVRAVPGQIQELLRPPRERCESALFAFDTRVAGGDVKLAMEGRHLADRCREAAAWFDAQAQQHAARDETARFFGDMTFGAPAARWLAESRRWDSAGALASTDALRAVYLQLLATFSVRIASFERKQFANLSHAPNKAMNVNTYLSLLGGSYRQETCDAGRWLSWLPLSTWRRKVRPSFSVARPRVEDPPQAGTIRARPRRRL